MPDFRAQQIALLKSMLRSSALAKDFLMRHLPQTLQAHVVYENLQMAPYTLVEASRRKQEADFIFNIHWKVRGDIIAAEGFIYCLMLNVIDLGAKSRIMRYVDRLRDRYFQKFPYKPRPCIYPMLCYASEASKNDDDFWCNAG